MQNFAATVNVAKCHVATGAIVQSRPLIVSGSNVSPDCSAIFPAITRTKKLHRPGADELENRSSILYVPTGDSSHEAFER
jgi:hypothetical protein